MVVNVDDETGEDAWDEDDSPAPEGEEGAEEEEEEPPSFFFEVRVAKADRVLAFECVTDGVEVDILRVDLKRKGAAADDDDAYTGPEYSTLDETLQDAFADYLRERGIDGAMAEYVLELANDKEQREYTNWLKSAAAFLRK